jgi:hypothetical protein
MLIARNVPVSDGHGHLARQSPFSAAGQRHRRCQAADGPDTDALLDFRVNVTLDGERLTASEIDELLAASDGLHLVRGRCVEVDRAKLGRMLDEFRAVEKVAKENGLDFAAAMRLLAGARVSGDERLDAAGLQPRRRRSCSTRRSRWRSKPRVIRGH